MTRRRALVGVGLLALLALVGACSLFGPSFAPAIDTAAMRSSRLASRFVEGRAGPIHFVTAGREDRRAPRVLFVHGSPGTWEAWRIWLEDPALRGRARLIALDRPGFGGSSRGRAEPSLAAQAEAAAAVLRADGGGAALVVGHSLGGPIAARLAVDSPELVRGLLLIAPSVDPELERRRWYNVAGSWRAVQLLLPVDWVVSNRELWPLRGELEALAPEWRRIRCPMFVLQGLDDRLVPPANADFVERLVPPDRLEVIRVAEAGHFLLWQRPALVRDALLARLAEPSPEDAGEPSEDAADGPGDGV